MLYEYGKRTRDFLGAFLLLLKFNFYTFEAFFPLALVGYEMIIANSVLCTLLAIYHLISNVRLWNNC